MKKPTVYALLAAALCLFGGLTAVYRAKHPGRLVPVTSYTEQKVSLLSGGTFQRLAEELNIPTDKRGSTVYAAAIEFSTPQLEKDGITAGFYFCDLSGKFARVYTDGSALVSPAEMSEHALSALEKTAPVYDETFALADLTDYGMPDYGELKVYIRRGDGIYIKTFPENGAPDALAEVLSGIDDALK